MPRSTYYQQVGNPTQEARLPSTRPRLAMRHSRARLSTRLLTLFGQLAICLFGALGILVFAPSRAITEAPVLSLVVMAAAAFWTTVAFQLSDRAVIMLGSVCGIIWILALFQPAAAMLCLLASALLAYLTYLFARHWCEVCTASPLPRQVATELCDEWQLQILLCSFAPPVCAALVLLLGNFLFPILFLLALAFLQLVYAISFRPGTSLLAIWNAIDSWCNYNAHENQSPGLLPSPAGNSRTRFCVVLATALLSALAFKMWLMASLQAQVLPVAIPPEYRAINPISIATGLSITLGVLLVPIALVSPVLVEAQQSRASHHPARNWLAIVNDLRESDDEVERQSYYMGRVVADQSPFLVPRQVYGEHGHFAGDAGSGKTSKGLAPWIEQTVMFGDCSLIPIDLKGDTLELLATSFAAAEQLHHRTGHRIPVKFFTNQPDLPTFAFNPMQQSYWQDFDLYDKADIFCGAAGLLYGTDYGAGWYSEANGAVAYDSFKCRPKVASFLELAEQMECTISSSNKELHSELKSAGVHVSAVANRLAACDALCVTPGTGVPQQVIDAAIDLASVFQTPQIVHFHLPSTTSPGTSPMIARLVVYMLLSAASKVERKCPVYLVIDEFQRMAAHNMAYVLQLARSMGVGVILANQSLDDLGDLRNAVETNCRYRQAFSVSSQDDQERMVKQSGETVELTETTTNTASSNGSSVSTSRAETILPRLSTNDVLLASDHPMRSIVKLSRGAGYAQYGGFPFVVESEFHIDREEYERRKAFPWPKDVPGTFIPREFREIQSATPSKPIGPIVQTEVLEDFQYGKPTKRSRPSRTPKRES